jgi:hypothetical protein
MATKVTSFDWNEADGIGVNYDLTLGFRPKLAFIWTNARVGTVDGIARGGAVIGYGFAVSDTDRRCVYYASVDAQATAFLIIRHSDVAALTLGSATGTDAGSLDVATLANWPTDGIRFTVDTALGVGTGNIRVHVLAVGDAGVTAHTLQFQESASSGAQAVAHGLGATPNGALFASVGFATAPPSGSVAQGMAMLGATDGVRQWVAYIGADDANTTMSTVSYARTTECIALGPEPAVTTDGRASLTSFDATNINLNWAERLSTRYIMALVWAGGAFRVDDLLTQTTTTPFTDSGYGLKPTAALFASCNRAASTADTPTTFANLSIGAATGPAERVGTAIQDENAVGTSECTAALQVDEVYVNIDATSLVQGLMDVQSFDADGMTLVMDDADPSQAFVGVAVWGVSADMGVAPHSRPFPFKPGSPRR